MGWLSDLHGGNRHWFSEQWKAVKDNPERLFLGAMDPVGTKLWNEVAGKDWDPVVDAWGGPSAQVYKSGEAKGLDMDASHNSHRVARVVAALGMGGGGGGGSGAGSGGATANMSATNPALIDSALGTAGYGASSAGAGGGAGTLAGAGAGSQSGWRSLMNQFGGGGMPSGGQQDSQQGGFAAFNDAFQRGIDPEGYERRRAREQEMAFRARQETREDERHAMAQAQAREAEAKRRRVTEALARTRALAADGVVTGAQGGMTGGGAQLLMADGYGGAPGRGAVQEAAADTYRETRRGMQAPGATDTTRAEAEAAYRLATQGVTTRAATNSEIMDSAANAALAAEDIGQWVGLRGEAKKAKFDEVFNGARDSYHAMSPEQRTQLVAEKSNDKSFPGYGAFVQGVGKDGKAARYLHYRTEGGKKLDLSDDDVADLVGFESAMKVDPARARAEMRRLKGDARTAALEMFKIGLDGAKLNNQVAEHQDRMDLGRQEMGLRREGLQLQRAHAPRQVSPETLRRMGEVEQEFFDAKGDASGEAAARHKYQVLLSRAGVELGRPMGLPDPRGGALKESDVLALVQALQADPRHEGKNVLELRRMAIEELGGGSAGPTLRVPGARGAGPTTEPPPATRPPVSDGRKNFGMLTSRADLEREVAAGNPHAIRYMDGMRENRVNAELGLPGY